MCIVGKLPSIDPSSYLSNPQNRYNSDLNKVQSSHYKCPCCGTVGKMKVHSHYQRYLHTSKNLHSFELTVTVFRCECKSCEHPYHAFLPLWICPFCAFTYSFLISVLGYFYGPGKEQLQTTAKYFDLSRTTVRRLIDHYSAEDWRIMQTELAHKNQLSKKRTARALAQSSESLMDFLVDFLHIHSESFFTRHFPLSSYWYFICYGLWDLRI